MSKLMIIPEKPCHIAGAAALPLSASEPDYKPVITDANLRRRMGRLLKMSVYCGLQALGDVASEEVAGIVTFTGMGFMKDTISFGNNIYDRDEDLLNPSPFMQSTFNTASGYIALIRKIRSYNTTYVQHASGFMASFADAVMLLDEHPGQHVPEVLHVFWAWLRRPVLWMSSFQHVADTGLFSIPYVAAALFPNTALSGQCFPSSSPTASPLMVPVR